MTPDVAGKFTAHHKSQPFKFTLTPVRKSRLLGKRITFERSTIFGFSPDTIFRVLSGRGLANLLEHYDYNLHLLVKALQRHESQGTRLQRSTEQELRHLLARTELAGAPLTIDRLRELDGRLASPWRLLYRSSKPSLNTRERRLLARLVYYDRLAHQIQIVREPITDKSFRDGPFSQSITYWQNVSTPLGPEIALCIDATLHHVAWLDQVLSLEKPGYASGTVFKLTNPENLVTRNWLNHLLHKTKTVDLLDFHNLLFRREVARNQKTISHDLLKKWSSNQTLIPFESGYKIIVACQPEIDIDIERISLWLVRLLIFLTECIVCFTPLKTEPLAAQKHLNERLMKLLNICESSQRKGG